MVEVIEYLIVLLSSSLFAGAPVVTYSAFSGFGAPIQTRAAFSSLADLAIQAALGGNSTSSIALPESTIGCSSGNFTLTSSTGTLSTSLGVVCHFAVHVQAGIHRVSFLGGASGLTIEVA